MGHNLQGRGSLLRRRLKLPVRIIHNSLFRSSEGISRCLELLQTMCCLDRVLNLRPLTSLVLQLPDSVLNNDFVSDHSWRCFHNSLAFTFRQNIFKLFQLSDKARIRTDEPSFLLDLSVRLLQGFAVCAHEVLNHDRG